MKNPSNIFSQLNKESILLDGDKRKYITSLQDAESWTILAEPLERISSVQNRGSARYVASPILKVYEAKSCLISFPRRPSHYMVPRRLPLLHAKSVFILLILFCLIFSLLEGLPCYASASIGTLGICMVGFLALGTDKRGEGEHKLPSSFLRPNLWEY